MTTILLIVGFYAALFWLDKHWKPANGLAAWAGLLGLISLLIGVGTLIRLA